MNHGHTSKLYQNKPVPRMSKNSSKSNKNIVNYFNFSAIKNFTFELDFSFGDKYLQNMTSGGIFPFDGGSVLKGDSVEFNPYDVIKHNISILPEGLLNATNIFSELLSAWNDTNTWNNNSNNNSRNNATMTSFSGDYTISQIITIAIIAGVLSVFTVLGNFMVMISFKMDKQLQTITNYFLLSLAVADLAIGLISMPLFTVYILYGGWPLGPYICDTWLAIDYLISNASVLNLLIISFDRYFSVTRPLTYRARRTTKRALFMIACAWIISLILWPPWIYSWPYIEGSRRVPENECYIQFLQTNPFLTFGTAIAAFYVPVTVMTILYWRVYRETEKRQKGLASLQAGKDGGSKKSTSSEDEVNESKRSRSDSSTALEELETTYVPTSALEDNFQLPNEQKQRFFRSCYCCKIDKETEYLDDESTSDAGQPGSPGNTTPASPETPTTFNRNVPFQEENSAQAAAANTKEAKRKASLMIPLITVDSQRNGPKKNASTTMATSPTAKSQISNDSNESVYTILIKLPGESSDDQPTIKMISEEEEVEAETSMQKNHQEESFMQRTSSTESEPESSSMINMPRSSGSLTRRLSQTTETMRLAVQAKIANRLAIKIKQQRAKKRRQERKQEKKAVKTLSAILLAFIITWTPYNVMVLILTFCEECVPKGWYYFSYYLCYINSTVNPLCYALCNANFRRTYIRILSCKWHNKKKHYAVNRNYSKR